MISGGVTYAPPAGFLISANVNYTGDRYYDERNTALAPAFTTLDASVGYRFNRVELRIDGRNLGDRRDMVSESEFGDSQFYRMTARTVMFGIAVNH